MWLREGLDMGSTVGKDLLLREVNVRYGMICYREPIPTRAASLAFYTVAFFCYSLLDSRYD